MSAPRHLDQIPYPPGVEDYLADCAERYGQLEPKAAARTFYETGLLPTTVPDRFFRPYLVCLLTDVLNEIIDGFNTITADLEQMPLYGAALRGSPVRRLELLVRGFYGEAYRGRELIFHVAGAMRRRGFIERSDVRELRAAFEEHLGPLYKIRHSLQHGQGALIGGWLSRLDAVEMLVEKHPDLVKSVLQDAEGVDKLLLLKASVRAYEEKAEAIAAQAFIFRQAFDVVVRGLAVNAGLADASIIGLEETAVGADVER